MTGKRSEDKTGLDRLNGETYFNESNAAVIAQPVIPIILGDQRPRSTKVSGTIWRGEGLDRIGVGRAKVQIKKDGKVFFEGMSEPNGSFKCFPVLPNGGYTLVVQTGDEHGEMNFSVKGYEVKDLNLTVAKDPRPQNQ